MASEGGAARAPPPDQLATFYKLVDKKVIAGVLFRHARNAELSALASVQAEALFGDDSLVVAHLRYSESEAFAGLCVATSAGLCVATSGAEEATLMLRSWTTLLSRIPLVLRRLEADTLLPGTLREEELVYDAHVQAAAKKATNELVPSPAVLRDWASTMAYTALLLAMYRSLDLLLLPLWPAAQKRMVESFVLKGLDVIPRTAGIPANLISGEGAVVVAVEKLLSQRDYDATFCAGVRRMWHSNAVSSVLRARGVLQTGIAKAVQTNAEFKARHRADIAKHGLRDCALPSCSKTEKSVKEFAGCTGCRFVVYCCLEHQALD